LRRFRDMAFGVLALAVALSISGLGPAVASTVQASLQRVLITNKTLPVTGSVSVDSLPPIKLDPAANTLRIDSVANTVKLDPTANTVKLDPTTSTVQADMGAPSQPVQFGGKVSLNGTGGDNMAVVYTVPAGKRLVIEFVSAAFPAPGTDEVVAFSTSNGPLYFLPLGHEPDCVANCPFWLGSEQTRVYANAGEQVTAHALGLPVSGTFSFSGYLVNAG
jgi:hypothetical protein